jgi:hypothetical protein
VQLPLLKPLETTLVASLLILLAELRKIMMLVLLDGENKTESSIGSLETHGEAIGEKMELSDSLEEPTTSESNTIALGQLQLILGLRMSEMKQSLKLKMLSHKDLCMLMQHAKDSLHL